MGITSKSFRGADSPSIGLTAGEVNEKMGKMKGLALRPRQGIRREL
jgi:hypothetical protein